MTVEQKNIEQYLSVGCIAVIQADSFNKLAPRCRTVIRGWRAGSHVILDRPRLPNGRFYLTKEAQQCAIRFVHDGNACSFESVILDWDDRRYFPYLRVRWPESLISTALRRHERVRVDVPCTIALGEQPPMDAVLRDIGGGGCAVVTRHTLVLGTSIALRAELPDGTPIEGALATVRNVQAGEAEGQHALGCAFDENQQGLLADVSFFVSVILAQTRGASAAAAPRVLVLDADPARLSALREALHVQGYDVVAATNTLDGLYRLRVADPSVVCISAAMPDQEAVQTCRLLRHGRGADAPSLFLYGASAAQQDAAQTLGLQGVLPDGPSLVDTLLRAVCAYVAENQARAPEAPEPPAAPAPAFGHADPEPLVIVAGEDAHAVE